MSVHIKGGKPPVFSKNNLPDDTKFAQSLDEAFAPLIESGHLDAIAALGHPIKSAADLDAWAKLGPNAAPVHPFTKAGKVKAYAAGKGGGKTVHVDVTKTVAPTPTMSLSESEQFVLDHPETFGTKVITNDPAKYVKNPAFDAEFQAKVKAEKEHVKKMKAFIEASPTTMDVPPLKKGKGIKIKLKKPDAKAASPVLDLIVFDEAHQQDQTILSGENAEHTPISIEPLWHSVNKVIAGVNPNTGETVYTGEPQITMPKSQYEEQIADALKNMQGVMLTQIASKFNVAPEVMAAATKELNDATKALTYQALYGGKLLDYKALMAEMEAGKHGTTSNAPTPAWASKTAAEIVADMQSVLKDTKPVPVPFDDEGSKILGDALKGAFKTEKTFQFNFKIPGQGEVKPFTVADLESFNQALESHTHTAQDSDMIKTKGPAMAMEDLTAAKVSEDQEPGLEFGVSTEEANSEVLQMVDEYTALQAQIDAADVSHLIKKQDELKKQLQSIAKSDQFPSHKPVQLWGTHENYVQFSEQKNMQKITDKPGLIDAIGMAKYMANTEITLANAKKLLSENELGKFTTNTPGPRTLNAVVLGMPEAD